MWELVSQFAVSIFLAVLAGDLLYLYYNGAWLDLNEKIEKAEIIALYALVIGALGNAIRVIVVLFGS